jgi:UDP-2,3-diacylglucosamine pyrophosphatase LpxH
MHDRLLDALLSVSTVRLVAALRDDRLGFPDKKDLRVFIPDVHLITDERRKEGQYVYTTNYPDLLTEVALALQELKADASTDETVAAYQLGDFLDLWREAPGLDDRLDAASKIKDDHEDLVSVLMDRKLKTRFLLGNHDFDLYRWPDYTAWERRYYLPDKSLQAPSVIVLHGDIFDWVEDLPDKVENVFVYLFAPHLSPNDYALGEMKSLIKQWHGNRNYRTYIQNRLPATLGSVRDGEAEAIPDRWNVQTKGSAPAENLKFLDSAYDCCAKANAAYQMNLRVAVIGHTHHARIAVRESETGELFTLIDCGAWIENCLADGDTDPVPNAQVAALSANEARIYQLSPKIH